MGPAGVRGQEDGVGREAGTRRTAYAGLVLGMTLLGACGQPDAPPPDAVDTVSVAIQPTITPIGTEPETFDIDPSAPAAEGLFDASSHLTTTSCAATGGVWNYAGTLENPENEPLTFTVAIILLRTSDMTEVETKELDITVPARAKVPVEAKSFYRSAETGLECLTGVTVKED